jgi:hypothetical protein
MQNIDEEYSALYMQQYGINSAILFKHTEMDKIIEDYESTDDLVWCNGRGKKFMFHLIKNNLKKEDKYFDKHTEEAFIGNERWDNFCSDCILLSALGAHLYGNPIMLLHPQSYEENFVNSPIRATDGTKPSLIKGIQILQ